MGDGNFTAAAAQAAAAIRNSNVISVVVKPNSDKNEITGYSSGKKAFVINIKAAAEKDKANRELLKFLKKATGKAFAIKSGSRSKEKILVSTSS
ncbi:DUF167 domain-containing protein [Candidatus Woesearchaeota archaeon]|nr:DUF167 domain-containing protein [Candidatus Woesearchaeota archaeon]